MRNFRIDPITVSIAIHAPIERVFALSTCVELVRETLGMKMVAGGSPSSVASGHIVANSRVHWRGWKFGLPTSHHTLITGFEEPHTSVDGERSAWFQDSQERGRFAFFQHDHFFHETLDEKRRSLTTLHDEVRFALPFGPVGRLVAALILAPHIRRLAHQRFNRIKALAESDAPDGWRAWLTEHASNLPEVSA